MSNIKQKTNNELLAIEDEITYLEGKLDYYRIKLSEAYLKKAKVIHKGEKSWEDGQGY
jgi:hypothetical protein